MVMDTEQQLEERLARPSPADVSAMRELKGDVVVLGVGGKMGPSLVRLMRRAITEAGGKNKIIAVARFSDKNLPSALESEGIETIACDLLEDGALRRLPDAANVIYMAARKFGTTGSEYLSWAINTQLPALVADRYRTSRIVCFSSGNVYPLRPIHLGGATEDTPVGPQGEYAQSVLGRERIFEHASHRWGTPVALLRLNYAIDLRYGVLADIATAVHRREPVRSADAAGQYHLAGRRKLHLHTLFSVLRVARVCTQPDRTGDAEHPLDRGRVWQALRLRADF